MIFMEEYLNAYPGIRDYQQKLIDDAYKKITEVLGEKQENRGNIYTKLPEINF